MRPEVFQLNQTLILGVLEAIEHWQTWTNVATHGATKLLNLQLIRLSKGLVKAWRVWLFESNGK